MAESGSLMRVLLLLVNYARVLRVDDASNVVSRVIDFRKLLRLLDILLRLVHSFFSPHLYHFPSISDQVIARTHVLGELLRKYLEPLKLNEFD